MAVLTLENVNIDILRRIPTLFAVKVWNSRVVTLFYPDYNFTVFTMYQGNSYCLCTELLDYSVTLQYIYFFPQVNGLKNIVSLSASIFVTPVHNK